MSNWKADRNYWKVTDAHGKAAAYVIEVEGREVEVSEDVFRCYAKGDRRDRYVLQDQKKGRFLSLEQLAQDEVREDYVGIPSAPNCLDILVGQEEEAEWQRMKTLLCPALASLKDADRVLIIRLFYEGKPQTEVAKEMGVSQSAISQRLGTVLRRLRKILKKLCC